MQTYFFTQKRLTLWLVLLLTITLCCSTEAYIDGPWLWMIADGSDIDADNLAIASGGRMTEDHIAKYGVNEGDPLGELQWTRGEIQPTVRCVFLGLWCESNNINELVNAIGLSSNRDINYYSAYALINIISPDDKNDVLMGVGSDDAVKVWLNGEVVHRNNVDRGTEGIQDYFRVNFKAGDNLLLVKVCENRGKWGMFFEIYLNSTDFTLTLPRDFTSPLPTHTTVYFPSSPVQSPTLGELLTFPLNITNGEDVAGYQATVQFDPTALRYISSANGDYLRNPFFGKPLIAEDRVTLKAVSFDGESQGNGTLATLTFEVIAVKESTLTLSEVILTNWDAELSYPRVDGESVRQNKDLSEARYTFKIRNPTGGPLNYEIRWTDATSWQNYSLESGYVRTHRWDGDNPPHNYPKIRFDYIAGEGFTYRYYTLDTALLFQDDTGDVPTYFFDWSGNKLDLFLDTAAAPSVPRNVVPKETSLSPNYPNPFNPETWIPYQLSEPADVTVSIYSVDGKLVRTLALGHQPAGVYRSRSRAVHWDGRNAFGEPVASGVYFYTLNAGEFTATRKMLIRK